MDHTVLVGEVHRQETPPSNGADFHMDKERNTERERNQKTSSKVDHANGKRLIGVFERLRLERGLPQVIRCANGPEFLKKGVP